MSLDIVSMWLSKTKSWSRRRRPFAAQVTSCGQRSVQITLSQPAGVTNTSCATVTASHCLTSNSFYILRCHLYNHTVSSCRCSIRAENPRSSTERKVANIAIHFSSQESSRLVVVDTLLLRSTCICSIIFDSITNADEYFGLNTVIKSQQ